MENHSLVDAVALFRSFLFYFHFKCHTTKWIHKWQKRQTCAKRPSSDDSDIIKKHLNLSTVELQMENVSVDLFVQSDSVFVSLVWIRFACARWIRRRGADTQSSQRKHFFHQRTHQSIAKINNKQRNGMNQRGRQTHRKSKSNTRQITWRRRLRRKLFAPTEKERPIDF